jgi:hypothetical protein
LPILLPMKQLLVRQEGEENILLLLTAR